MKVYERRNATASRQLSTSLVKQFEKREPSGQRCCRSTLSISELSSPHSFLCTLIIFPSATSLCFIFLFPHNKGGSAPESPCQPFFPASADPLFSMRSTSPSRYFYACCIDVRLSFKSSNKRVPSAYVSFLLSFNTSSFFLPRWRCVKTSEKERKKQPGRHSLPR